MASFAEIREKMNSKYGDSEEEKKRQQEQKRQNITASATSNFESLRSEMESKYNPANSVDDNFITVFLSDATKYLNSTESDYKRVKYGNSASMLRSKSQTADDLRSRSFSVRQYMEKNKGSFEAEDYDSFMSWLDDFDNASQQGLYAFYEADRFYSNFDNEEQYNFWDTHNTAEKRQQWYTDQQSKLDALKAEKEAENKRWGAVDPIEVGINSPEWQQGEQEHLEKLKGIDKQINLC